MPHFMMRRTKDDGKPHAYPNPFMVTMRYRCECDAGEVIQISTIFDLDLDEERFIWTMKRLRRDMQIEVEQHLKTRKELPK